MFNTPGGKITSITIPWILSPPVNGKDPDTIARLMRARWQRVFSVKQQDKDNGHIPELNDPG